MNDWQLDEEIVTDSWPLPLPLFESESANEAVKPSLWQRVCAWGRSVRDGIEEAFNFDL